MSFSSISSGNSFFTNSNSFSDLTTNTSLTLSEDSKVEDVCEQWLNALSLDDFYPQEATERTVEVAERLFPHIDVIQSLFDERRVNLTLWELGDEPIVVTPVSVLSDGDRQIDLSQITLINEELDELQLQRPTRRTKFEG